LQHYFFFDGNKKTIAWAIQTKELTIEQNRAHPEIYLNKITILQSKFIAVHVGLFWGIGRFIIKDEDTIIIKTTDKIIFDYLSSREEVRDKFIKNRIFFINQLIQQRKLKMKFEFIDENEKRIPFSIQ
jgi:hypothetical protein